MIFRIKAEKLPKYVKSRIYIGARRVIILFPQGVAEINLDKYFIAKYKKSLKQICLDILKHTTFAATENNELTITFNQKKYDDLACLITYGNGKLQGSNILKYAFCRD